MLTLDEIEHAKIHPATAKEALAQVERRLSEVLETKKAIEQKSTTLLAAYVTLSVALSGAAGAIYRENQNFLKTSLFALSALCFIAGAMTLIAALRAREYGNLGSAPDMWLTEGRINGDEVSLARMQAYLVFYYKNRIDVSLGSNRAKHRLLEAAIILGLAGVVLFIVSIIGFFLL